jgi:DNA mismatch endonuclease (patch repair protein)
MADVFTKTKRSAVMSRIRGAGNKDTELRLISMMRESRITGWRRGAKLQFGGRGKAVRQDQTPSRSGGEGGRRGRSGNGQSVQEAAVPYGKTAATVKTKAITIRPDFVFPKEKLAVFVDGCFWHGCPKHATWPKNNADFWRKKIEGNRARDRLQNRLLRAKGWRVLRIWEHALTRQEAARTMSRLKRALE